jgi:hypothetical protein
VRPQQQENGIFVKSYRYLRLAMVTLLGALFAAVIYQTVRQEWVPLASVSAYYYTPAQAMFVGALIGFAACMIALKGTTDLEDVSLNLAGMFAALVAIVPTSRGADFDDAVAACREEAGPLLTQKASEGSDCPSQVALADAAEANIENNMWAVLIVGAVAAALIIVFGKKGRAFWWAYVVGVALLLLGGLAFFAARDWFVHNAHWVAAACLFVCIFIVATENALRQKGKRSGGTPPVEQTPMQTAGETVGVLVSQPRNSYAWIARIMLFAGGFAVFVWWRDWISLFWLEVWVFTLFIAFWIAQTIEQSNKPPGSEHIKEMAPQQQRGNAPSAQNETTA